MKQSSVAGSLAHTGGRKVAGNGKEWSFGVKERKVFGKCIQGQYTGEEREIGGTVIIISKSQRAKFGENTQTQGRKINPTTERLFPDFQCSNEVHFLSEKGNTGHDFALKITSFFRWIEPSDPHSRWVNPLPRSRTPARPRTVRGGLPPMLCPPFPQSQLRIDSSAQIH
jgi:hypothetical protein